MPRNEGSRRDGEQLVWKCRATEGGKMWKLVPDTVEKSGALFLKLIKVPNKLVKMIENRVITEREALFLLMDRRAK